ncbi:MAG: 23S rRNA (adenine(2030)-N(6))-methyltransferase RlmJ [Gammaproteobacteria bacterium]|nr:23S rRNA (adenine(2030)-N(6))-methyltransferase RlmJ [Gammaproteobacteria bacterium]
MNYRHAYHAGSFADVLKHLILVELIKCLKQKEKPFFYLDTHAGRGIYDLAGIPALKTHEADSGIKRLLALEKIPFALADYMSAVKACQSSPRDYPGSPLLVRQLMRPGDRMALTELHPQEFECLKTLFARDSQVLFFLQDAYQGLRALLPPTPRRGLVLIDPAFEVTHEFDCIISGLEDALRRFQNGIYAIWYPIKDRYGVARWMRQLKALNVPFLNVSIQPEADSESERLRETGVVILNPPWQFDLTLKKIIPSLLDVLSSDHRGQFHIDHYGV